MPAVMNSANEVAVDLFLKGKLSFNLIFDTIKYCMDEYDIKINKINLGIDELIDIDQKVRKTAMDFVRKNT